MLLALLVWSTLVRRCPKKYRERTEPDALPHTSSPRSVWMVTIGVVASLLHICAVGGLCKGIGKKVQQHSFAIF